jgi:hypothetical protein
MRESPGRQTHANLRTSRLAPILVAGWPCFWGTIALRIAAGRTEALSSVIRLALS